MELVAHLEPSYSLRRPIERPHDGRVRHAAISARCERSDLSAGGVQDRLVDPALSHEGFEKKELPIQAAAPPRVEFLVLPPLGENQVKDVLHPHGHLEPERAGKQVPAPGEEKILQTRTDAEPSVEVLRAVDGLYVILVG